MRSVRIASLALTAGALLLAGCAENITGEAQQVGEPGLNFSLDVSGARGAPAGRDTIIDFEYDLPDPLPPDAFQRGGTDAEAIGRITGGCLGSSHRTASCYRFRTTWNNSWARDRDNDPRLERIESTTGADSVPWFDLAGPDYFAARGQSSVKAWELFARFGRLEAGTSYHISLARYGVQVRGGLDNVEMLLHGYVRQPDSLVLIRPSDATVPGVNYNWVSNLRCNDNLPPVGANPFNLGMATANANGVVTFDKCFASAGIWYSGTTFNPDSSPIVRNSVGPHGISQQYNYIEVREGGPDGPLVSRTQVGADLDPSTEAVIANAYAPFPATRLPATYILGTLRLGEGGPSAVRMTILPLDTVAQGGEYRIMLFDRATGQSAQANATYYTVRSDTTGRDPFGVPTVEVTTSPATVVNAIRGGAGNVMHVIEVHDSVNTAVRVRDFTDVVLQPAGSQSGMIWYRYRDASGTDNTTQDDQFFAGSARNVGVLPLVQNPTPYSFFVSGNGFGTNRGSELSIRFQHLPRPPAGYYYNVWLVPKPGSNAQPVSLGSLTTPLPEERSLRDADVDAPGGVLTPTTILEAIALVRPAQLQALGVNLSDYGTVRLTLEPKGGTEGMSPWVLLEGAFAARTPASSSH